MNFVAPFFSGRLFAQREVFRARRAGLLPDPQSLRCADCGKRAVGYDHRDYNYALMVEPVCSGCNVRRGPAIPKRWLLEEWLTYVMVRAQQAPRRITHLHGHLIRNPELAIKLALATRFAP